IILPTVATVPTSHEKCCNFLSFHASHLSEVKCPPQARSLEVKSNSREHLKLQHKRVSLEEFIEQVPSDTFNEYDTLETIAHKIQLSSVDSEGLVPVIEICGDLKTKDINLKLNRNSSKMLFKSYNNEQVNMKGRFYFPDLSSGAIILKHGNREILRFG
ncbi:hypothetical protein RIF25_09785, partial [Thermosynechococcaceae cyanobacterium BACA0444]